MISGTPNTVLHAGMCRRLFKFLAGLITIVAWCGIMSSSRPSQRATTKLRRSGTKPLHDSGAEEFSLAVQPPVSKKPRGGWACYKCGTTPDKDTWAYYCPETGAAMFDACLKCWRPFRSDFQRDGDWHSVCERSREDEAFNNEFSTARAVLGEEAFLGVDPCEVTDSDAYEVHTVRSFIGIPRSDYSRMCGASPSVHGFTETDAPNEHGQPYKAILIQNPLRPWVEYNLVHKRGVSKDDKKLAQQHHCRVSQGNDALQRARHALEHDRFVTKLRNCSLTMENIEQACGRPNLLSTFVGLRAPGSSSDGSRGDSGVEKEGPASATKSANALERAPSVWSLAATPPKKARHCEGSPSGIARSGSGALDDAAASSTSQGAASGAGARVSQTGKSRQPIPPSGAEFEAACHMHCVKFASAKQAVCWSCAFPRGPCQTPCYCVRETVRLPSWISTCAGRVLQILGILAVLTFVCVAPDCGHVFQKSACASLVACASQVRSKAEISKHSTAIDIPAILKSARGSGHPVRWAREFVHKHSKSTSSNLAALSRLVQDAESAIKLASSSIPRMQVSDFVAHVKRLAPIGDVLPPHMMMSILEKWLDIYADQHDYEKFMRALLPWKTQAQGESDDMVSFNPSKPSLSGMNLEPAASAGLFQQHMLGQVTKLVRGGATSPEPLDNFITKTLEFLATHEVTIDSDGEGEANSNDFDDASDLLTSVCKSLLLLDSIGTADIHVHYLSFADRLDVILAARDLRGAAAQASPFVTLATDLHNDESRFAQKIELWTQSKASIKSHLPKLLGAVHDLRRRDMLNEDSTIPQAWPNTLRSKVMPAIAELPSCVSGPLEAKVSELVKRHCDHCLELLEAGVDAKQGGSNGPQTPIDKVALGNSLRAYMDVVLKCLPGLPDYVGGVLEQLEQVHSSVVQAQSLSEVKAAVAKFIELGDKPTQSQWEAFHGPLSSAVRAMDDPVTTLAACRSELVVVAERAVRNMVAADDGLFEACDASVALATKAMKEDFAKEHFSYDILAAKAKRELLDAEKRWASLGDQLDKKLDAEGSSDVLLAWKACACQLEEAKAKCKVFSGDAFNEVLATHQAKLKEIGARVLQRKKAFATQQIDKVTAHLTAAEWPLKRDDGAKCKPWEDFVEKGASWLEHEGGDALIKGEADMRAAGVDLAAAAQLWGHDAQDRIDLVHAVGDKVHSLTFTIKAVRAIDKLMSEEPVGEMRMRRYIRARRTFLAKEDNAGMKPWLPQELLDKFDSMDF